MPIVRSRFAIGLGPLDCARDDVSICSYLLTQLWDQDWRQSIRVPCGMAVLVQVGSSDIASYS